MTVTPQQRMETLVRQIQSPRIADRSFFATDYGAVPNATHCQTEALQAAIDDASRRGGGIVVVPAGRFLTGALWLKSGVNLHLSTPDTVLAFTTQLTQQHYPLALVHWEATPCYNYSALVYAHNAHDIALTGPGKLDGQASFETWWAWHHQVENAWSKDGADLQHPARMALRQMNEAGLPVAQRWFGDGHFLRPNFFQALGCQRVLVEEVTFLNSPMWQLNPVNCDHVIIRGVTLCAHGPNSDGCDPESCRDVLIEGCRFDTGDDCISIKSGRDRDGRNAPPCERIIIRNNLFADGHGGIALGSEMSGGIRDVYAQHNRFESPHLTYILRFKTNAKRGGFVENVWLADTTATAVGGAALHATMMYEDGPNGDFLPRFENITVERLQATGGDYGIFLEAFEPVPIRGLTLRDITIDHVTTELRAMNWAAPVLQRVTINGSSYPRPTAVQILGVPTPGKALAASCQLLGDAATAVTYGWLLQADSTGWQQVGAGAHYTPTEAQAGCKLKLTATDRAGQTTESAEYLVLPTSAAPKAEDIGHLKALGLLALDATASGDSITRMALATMLAPLCQGRQPAQNFADVTGENAAIAQLVLQNGLMAADGALFRPDAIITRQEFATVAMQVCGVSYKNASSTMPICADSAEVSPAYGTNVARALYFGFMALENDHFYPHRPVTVTEAIQALHHVLVFAGL